jgi:hypothetical protein
MFDGIITACEKALVSATDASYCDAVMQQIEFWSHASLDDSDSQFGHFVVVRSTAHCISDEWTNIGIIFFSRDGQQVFQRMGPYWRAIFRGDLRSTAHLDTYAKVCMTVDQAHRMLESTGHHMSSIQITTPRATRLGVEIFESLYCNFVLGIYEE